MKKTRQSNNAMNTCVKTTGSSVIQIIHRNIGLKWFFLFHLPKCLFVIIIIYVYISLIFLNL